MITVCQQPNYFPWIGYFEQIAQADTFVFLDSVQWIKQGRQHRTKLPNQTKENYWLTLPVHSKGHRSKLLKEMQVQAGWAERHWQVILNTFRHAPYFSQQLEPLILPFLEKNAEQKFLLDICQESLFLFWDLFALSPHLHWSSDMPSDKKSTERLVEICEKVGANQYYSALGSTRYLQLDLFRAKGIQVRWQHLRANYPGNLSRPSDYSILDWLAEVEISEIQKIIKQKVKSVPHATEEHFQSQR